MYCLLRHRSMLFAWAFVVLSGIHGILLHDALYAAQSAALPAPHTGITANSSGTEGRDSSQIQQLDSMVVRAGKHARQMASSQSLSIIKSEVWMGSGKSVADVVAEQTGVQTRHYGGAGSFQTVSVRGVQGGEVLVLLDGIPLNSAMGGAVDLGKINPALLGEIELYKGSVPGVLGGNSIGGVINCKTVPVAAKHGATVYGEIGSYGVRKISGSLYHAGDSSRSLFTSASFVSRKNDFPYLDRNNTILGTLIDPRRDDTLRSMQNNQFTAFDVAIHPTLPLNEIDCNLRSGLFMSHSVAHVPAKEGLVNKTARSTDRRMVATMLLESRDESSDRVLPRIGIDIHDVATEWTHEDDGFGASHGGVGRYGMSALLDRSLSCDLTWNRRLTKTVRVQSTAFTRATDVQPRYDRDGVAVGNWQCRKLQAGGAADIEYTPGVFKLMLGGSIKGDYDATEGGLDALSNHLIAPADTTTSLWSLTAGVSAKPIEQVLLFTNGARYSDEPSLRERYGGRGAVMANPELQPETGYLGEVGCKLSIPHYYLETTLFYVRMLNSIVFEFDGNLIKPLNNAGAQVAGIEVHADMRFKYWALQVFGTWQKTENLQLNYRGKRLPDEPDLTLRCSFEATPAKRVRMSYQPEFKSFYFHNRSNDIEQRVPLQVQSTGAAFGHLYHSMQCTWTVVKRVDCVVSGRNITFLPPDHPDAQIESGYSWILYPSNEWSLTVKYSW